MIAYAITLITESIKGNKAWNQLCFLFHMVMEACMDRLNGLYLKLGMQTMNTIFFKSMNLFILMAAVGALSLLPAEKDAPVPSGKIQVVHRDIIMPHMTLTPEIKAGMFLERLHIDTSLFEADEIEKRLSPWDKYVTRYSARYGVNPDLVRAIIYTESKGRPLAVSHQGAQGLMQLMPVTASSMGINNPLDPEENIRAGVKYIAWLVKNGHQRDDSHLLWAWNAGPTMRGRNIIPAETRRFIVEVLSVKRFLEEDSPMI